jgi:hypothetical protein
MKQYLYLLAISVSLFILFPHAHAATDVGVGLGLSPMDSSQLYHKDKKLKPVDPFIRVLARHFNQQENHIMKLSARGFGRNELVKLLLICSKSGKDIKEIVRQRDHNDKLSEIAARYTIDYPALLTEAETVRRQIDFEVPASTMTAGGTSNQSIIVSSATAPAEVNSSTAPAAR